MHVPNYPEELLRVALTMVPDVGPILARRLVDHFGSARAVFEAERRELKHVPGIGPTLSASIHSPDLPDKAAGEMAFLRKNGISALCYGEQGYPPLLKECPDAPALLYHKGLPSEAAGFASAHLLSVVGTRKATSYGREMCRRLITGLSRYLDDLVVISGLAYGIDVMAHRAALENGLRTIAVLGHGFRTLYPWAHREDAKKIVKQGALVTDFHSRMGPEKNNFLRRNRIIAGLSHATLVVESAESGGSLITASMASGYQRGVFAVPGKTNDAFSQGCNRLIKTKMAEMVESPEDVMFYLGWDLEKGQPVQPTLPLFNPSRQEEKLLSLIRREPGVDPGRLCRVTGIPVHLVLSCLTEMELKGWILAGPGQRYTPSVTLPPIG